MKVIDNFLPEGDHKRLLDMFLSSEFPWYFYDEKVVGASESFYNSQLCHTFFENHQTKSNWNISTVIDNLKPKSLVRIKANLTQCIGKVYTYGFHRDVDDFVCNTAVYYLNSNDGYTIFEDGAKIESVANRIVVFSSDKRHTGTSCTNAKSRVVLNLNFF